MRLFLLLYSALLLISAVAVSGQNDNVDEMGSTVGAITGDIVPIVGDGRTGALKSAQLFHAPSGAKKWAKTFAIIRALRKPVVKKPSNFYETYFESYPSYDEHVEFLDRLSAKFPGNSEIFDIGKSFENRPIRSIRIWGKNGKDKQPNAVFHGGTNAREWTTSMAVERLASQLLHKYGKEDDVTKIVDNFEIWAIPLINPDGFKFSCSKGGDRAWVKNRQTIEGSSCIGTNLNRNWAYQWEVPGGASTKYCSNEFRGLEPADSPEVRAAQKHLLELKDKNGIALFIDTHSSWPALLSPYAYSEEAKADNQDDQRKLIKSALEKVEKVHRTRFHKGHFAKNHFGIQSGTSMDWAKGVAEATYSYTFQLRGQDETVLVSGDAGYTLPAEKIIKVVEEAYAGCKSLLRDILEKEA